MFGTYRGRCRQTDLSAADGALGPGTGSRFFREKKWQWFAVSDARLACGGTLLDAGYATTVFLWVFDRQSRRMLADETDILPPFAVEVSNNPGPGGRARLRGLRRRFSLERGDSHIDLDASFESIQLDLTVDSTDPPALTAICPVGDGEPRGINITQKQSCLPVRGRIAVNGRTFELGEDALAMLDYTHGLMERNTRWRWAIGAGLSEDGTPIGFNFVEGFNNELENAIWVDRSLRPVEPIYIEFDSDRPTDPWTFRSRHAALDLSLVVDGLREHETNFRVVSSKYLQPLGRCHGRIIDREVHDLFALAERHHAKW